MPECSNEPGCGCWGHVQESYAAGAGVVDPFLFKRTMIWRFRDQLVSQTPKIEKTPDGPKVVTVPPLLLELKQEVKPSGERAAGRSGSGPGVPIAAAALDLWQEISQGIHDQCWLVFDRTGDPIPEKEAEKLRYWVDALGNDEQWINEAYRTLGYWVSEIERLFDPPVVVELGRACPACHTNEVREQVDGETVVNRAVIATIRAEASPSVLVECKGCGATWQGESIHVLEELTRPQQQE